MLFRGDACSKNAGRSHQFHPADIQQRMLRASFLFDFEMNLILYRQILMFKIDHS